MKKVSVVILACVIVLLLCSCGSETEKMIEAAEAESVVTLGSYEQDGDTENGAEPIEWRVIEKTEDGLLLLSEYIIESMPYNNEKGEII